MNLFGLVRPAFFALDPERAHALSIAALRSGLLPPSPSPGDPRLDVRVAGITFSNPVGIAAGYDKNAQAPDGLLAQGFGFAEIGTVTPRPQAGNPRPRLFRLARDRAVINRMGFNNDGHDRVFQRMAARRGRAGIVGVNIGANKDSADFVADYETGLRRFWDCASYFTANISSPNTPGLRNLQAGDALSGLLARLLDLRDRLGAASGDRRPVFLKIAPDLDERAMDEIAAAIGGTGLDGLIVSNTTLSRSGLKNATHAGEAGGLSGRPLFERSTIVLARMRQRVGDLPIIGVGGIDSARTALAKFEAGANLVQLYTGMIFRGPAIAAEINRGLLDLLAARGMTGITELTGRECGHWASKKLPEEV